jgi:hypothetical protein
MRPRHALLFLITSIILCTNSVRAQPTPSAAERLDNLKLQLIDVKAKEETAKLRLQQLDEALKPENIERSLAGVGSTRPEELREQRRQQLTIEKKRVTAELASLTNQRSRLEASISSTEVEAYQESAKGPTPWGNGLLASSAVTVRRLMIGSTIGVVAIVLLVAILLRRVSARNTSS